jgi:type II secretory pathway component GspD/PulD (secretin)
MFGSILGRKKDEIAKDDETYKALLEKISHMNLTEMRSYINNKIKDFPVSEDGLNTVLRHLTTPDAKTKQYYIQASDMDSKKKKAFNLVLAIAKHKQVNVVTVELIQKFIDTYKDIIQAYDKEYKEIYESRLKESINQSLQTIAQKAELQNKMNILGQ